MQLRSEIKGAVSMLGLVAAFILVAVSIDFGIPGQVLLQSLRFHIAAAVAGIGLLLFVLRAWRRGSLVVLIAVASAGEGGYEIAQQQLARAPATADAPVLKLLSFNVLADNYENGAAIADLIKGSGADIVVLMEASPLFEHLARIAEVYPFRAGCDSDETCDLTLLSRTPLAAAEISSLGHIWANRMITARTTISGEEVTLVAAHLVKPYFDGAAIGEARQLGDRIDAIKGPLVLAGDFNAAPWSDSIARLLRTTGLAPGPGYPATWPVKLGPLGVPIDNVFARAPLVIDTVRALDDSMGSNHRALWAEISIGTGES